MMSCFDDICGKVAPGLCRITAGGTIAVRTSCGYRSYDPERKRLINCDHFVLDIGEDFFFVMPANRVRPGDIILSGGKPRCVISVEENTITALNYEDAALEVLMPEHHLFMGNTYLYGRIVSPLGGRGIRGKKGAGRIMKYMMLSSMMRAGGGKEDRMGGLLPLMLMGGKMEFPEGLFDEEDDEEEKDCGDGEGKES